MKYFAYLSVMILFISVAALFYLQRPDGETWLSTDAISHKSSQLTEQMLALPNRSLNQIVKTVSEASRQVVTSFNANENITETVIYKWQDQQGQWHYSDQPNPDGASEAFIVDPADITVIAAEDTSILNGSAKGNTPAQSPNTVSVYDPNVVNKLFKESQQVKEKLERHTKSLEELN